MPRLAFPLALAVIVLLHTEFAQGQNAAGEVSVGKTGEQLVAHVKATHKELGFRGVVMAGQGGKVIAAVGVGDIQPDAKGAKPNSIDIYTMFELASCSKPITAIAVMKLAEEGKLTLDDPIAKHLPGVPDDCRAITVRHLLQHTSGIPGANYQGSGTDLAEVLPMFLKGGPQTTPGEKHEYWNQGYSLLSEVIARASGKPYTEYCREAIFVPFKMTSTRFTGDKPPAKATVAIGASTRGASRSALEHPYGEYGFQYRGMGGIVTNVVDLWKLDRALVNDTLLTAESKQAMFTPGPGNYGLGWQIGQLESGQPLHEHTGSVRGFLASMRHVPEGDISLYVLAASDDSQPFDEVKQGCEQILAGKAPDAGQPEPPAANLAKDLQGEYRDAQGRVMEIKKQGKKLQMTIDWHGPVTRGVLVAQSETRLTLKMKSASGYTDGGNFDIERDAAGKVTAVVFVDGESPLRFAREK